MLEIYKLSVVKEGKPILNGLSLHVKKGEIHAIMGPNGAGKSTLAKVLAGDPSYEIVSGEVIFDGKNLLELAPEERSHLGLFMGFQYPIEIPGVTNFQFLHAAHSAKQKAQGSSPLSEEEFSMCLDEKMAPLEMKDEFKERGLNEGYSGGEKKRNEILQMALLEPKLAVLDETDSGLDIDAIRIVSKGINRLMHAENALLLITHYQRLLDYIHPTVIHVMREGRVAYSGGPELAKDIEERGYEGS